MKIELTGDITKVTRSSNSPIAVVTLKIPSEVAGKLPMGTVDLTVTPSQGEMFKDK